MTEQVKVFETSDLGFSAYLKMNGMTLKNIALENNSSSNHPRYKFVFENNEELIKKNKINYINSESYKFDSTIRILKLMIKSELELRGTSKK